MQLRLESKTSVICASNCATEDESDLCRKLSTNLRENALIVCRGQCGSQLIFNGEGKVEGHGLFSLP